MSCTIEGLDSLIEKLNDLDKNITKKVAAYSLKKVARKVKNDMVDIAPVSKVRSIHGYTAIDVGELFKKKSYISIEIGLSQAIRSGGGADYWELIRG